MTELVVRTSIADEFMLCSDIVQGVHTGDSQQPILRALHPIASSSKHVYTFIRPYYIELRKDLLDNVNIY